MWSDARHVAAGDTVIIWLTRDQVQPLIITPGKDFNTKFGNFKQQDFVGVPYGSKVPSRSGRGFVHILRPTPELWTVALPHRTQILYLADIAFITAHLAIRPGSRVIEAGTGSASFSHSIARTIGASGHLYSYEFHEARYIKAKDEFARHGMDSTVTLTHRNVCKDGFTVVDAVDAVFLDLPAPWDAVEHAKSALRKDRLARICCFSPCIEQVLRTVNALNEAGFSEITTHETLLRPIEVFQQPAPLRIEGVAEKLKRSERRREEKRVRQVAANRAAEAARVAGKRKREEGEGEKEEEGQEVDVSTSKKLKTADDEIEAEEDADVEMSTPTTITPALPSTLVHPSTSTSTSALPPTSTPTASTSSEPAAVPAPAPTSSDPTQEPTERTPLPTPLPKINVAKALPEVRGHTSYLTFACLVPLAGWVSSSGEGAGSKSESESEVKLDANSGDAGAGGVSVDAVSEDVKDVRPDVDLDVGSGGV